MRSRWFSGILLAVSAVVATTAGPARTEPAPAAVVEQPNIVLIMVDDMRTDELRYLPETLSLVGAQGVELRNSFSPHPLCCPARASVLTGLHTHNHRVFNVGRDYGFSSFDDRSTLATWLQAAGYATAYVGKYLNGYGSAPEPGRTTGDSVAYVPPGWSDWRASIDGGLPADHPDNGGTYRYWDTTLTSGGEGFTGYPGRYQTVVYGRLTEQIVAERAADPSPFLLYVSYTAPHAGSPKEADDPKPVLADNGTQFRFPTPAVPHYVRGIFDPSILAAPGASWVDPDFTDKPSYLRRLPPMNDLEKGALLEVTRQRAEALAVVDQQVRRTVQALEAAGELDNTIIVFTADNGFFLGEQRIRTGKVWPYDPSLRVPLLIRGPGIPAGQTRADPVTSVDLAPTLAELAGIEPGLVVDGRSLAGVIKEGDQGWTRPVLTQTGPNFGVVRQTDEAGRPLRFGREPDIRYALGIRTGRFLYVDLATGEKELYNVRRDPQQYHNLAGDPDYRRPRRLLAEVLAEMRACDGAGCDVPLPPALVTGP